MAAGYSNNEIAVELVVAVSTVKNHINNIYGKLEVHSRTQAVARAGNSIWLCLRFLRRTLFALRIHPPTHPRMLFLTLYRRSAL